MDHYAGLDVSLEQSSVGIVNGSGKIVREAKLASEPMALSAWFGSVGLSIGLEAGPLSQWLYAGMKEAGLPRPYVRVGKIASHAVAYAERDSGDFAHPTGDTSPSDYPP